MIPLLRYGTVVAVAGAVCYATFDQRPSVISLSHGMRIHHTYSSGWPLICATWRVSEPQFSIEHPDFRRIEYPLELTLTGFTVDILSASVIVACTFYVARYILPKLRTFRCSLSSLFISTTVVATLTMVLRHELVPMSRAGRLIASEPDTFYPITLYSWWIYTPVLYGIACVVIVASLVLGEICRIVARRLTRHTGNAASREPSL
jgi:hypothetical protein